jgi:hypothetical protein
LTVALTLDDLRELAVESGFQVASLADREGLELHARGASGPLRFRIFLELGARRARFRTVGYLYCPGDQPRIKAILDALNELNQHLPSIRFVLEPGEGEVIVSADFDLAAGKVNGEEFQRFLRACLDVIDRLRPGLLQAADGGNIGLSPHRDIHRWLAALGRARAVTKKFIATPYTPDAVDCAVFSQREAHAGDSVFVQVFAYMPGYADEAQEQAREYDEEAKKLGCVSLTTEILRGSVLVFELVLRDMVISDPVQRLVWRGKTQSVQFEVPIPSDCDSRNLIGKVLISQDSVPIGQILFKLKVVGRHAAVDATYRPSGDARRYRKAFISYASKDRPEVLRRVQMLAAVGLSYFQDVLDLEPGDRWAQKLYEHMDQSDVLFLFWSTAAKESEWVRREWQYGLERKGADFIHPVIIEGPPTPEPPPELADLHFADKMLYFITSPAHHGH